MAQNLDFPLAEFLHFFPSLVFAAHFGVFAAAIVSSLLFLSLYHKMALNESRLLHLLKNFMQKTYRVASAGPNRRGAKNVASLV